MHYWNGPSLDAFVRVRHVWWRYNAGRLINNSFWRC